MSTQPTCGRCHRSVIRAVTAPGQVPITLDATPSADGVYDIDWDHAPRPLAWRYSPLRGNPLPARLYRRHAETCPRGSG